MSWKYVFNTNLGFLAGSSYKVVQEFVMTTGYVFFTFNGIIHHISGEPVGIKVEDLY